MVYVTSDLHGYPFEDFMDLLGRAGFGSADELYVLGDVIDRNGDGGIGTLRWMMNQPNVHLLRGNHEDMLLRCAFLFDGVSPYEVDRKRYADFSCWVMNGGRVTIKSLMRLMAEEPEEAQRLIEYIRQAPLYRELTVDGKKYFLSHAGIGSYEPGRPLDSYDDDDFLWFRPGLDTRYEGDAKIICGHTPVICFGEEYRGQPLRTETWTDIDTGAAWGESPTLMRLGDEEAFSASSGIAA